MISTVDFARSVAVRHQRVPQIAVDHLWLFGEFDYESLVRLEFAPKELPKALNVTMSAILNKQFKSLGFKFVTVDLEGYRSGSLNEVLPLHPSQD